jgi:hypothetical protein
MSRCSSKPWRNSHAAPRRRHSATSWSDARERKIVALYRNAWPGLDDAPARASNPAALWRKAVWFKANPRSAGYMRALLDELHPGARFVDVAAESRWAEFLPGADAVVLLYPDAIGIGFGGLERRLRRLVPQGAIRVVNGRRRGFALDPATRRRLLVRRALERSMLIECVVGAVMLAATPVLWGVDFARGRR